MFAVTLLLALCWQRGVAQVPDTVPTVEATPAVLAAAPAPAALAETAAPTALSQSIFLDVHDLGNDTSSSFNWKTTWGSYSKTQHRTRALELTLRNPAKVPGEYLVEWYFFAVPAKGGRRILFDAGSQELSLAAGDLVKTGVASSELSTHSTRYSGYYGYYYNSSYKSGMRPDGWAVTVKIGEKLVRTKTSSAQIEEMLKMTAEFEAMLARFKGKG